MADKGTRANCPDEYYTDFYIDKRERRKFGNFEINVLYKADEYLSNTYGENWKTEAKTHYWNHVTQHTMNQVTFELTEELLKPAMPFE